MCNATLKILYRGHSSLDLEKKKKTKKLEIVWLLPLLWLEQLYSTNSQITKVFIIICGG